jgi:CubicO group peptidase (beta-lactamase class C family)
MKGSFMRFARSIIAVMLAAFLAWGALAQPGSMPSRRRAPSDDPLQNVRNLIQRSGEFQQAIEELSDLLEQDKGNAEAWYLLGLAYHGQREWAKAIEADTKASEFRDRRPLALFNLARAEAMNGNKIAALESLALASKAGFREQDRAADEPELAILHGDPRFEKWVDSLSAPAEGEGPKAGPGDLHATVNGELGERLDERVQALGKEALFSGSVVVWREGRTVLEKGFGLADREHRTPIAARTPFPIGSITRTFTAATILRLEQAGLLSVDDAISKHLPDVPHEKQAITIHQLLCHTSGLSDEWRSRLIPTDLARITTREDAERAILASPLAREIDARSEECDSGYVLLAAIIERVSKQPFEAAVRDRVLVPAKLASIHFVGEELGNDAIAIGYGSPDRPEIAQRWPATPWTRKGAEGLLCSGIDLVAWTRALSGDDVLDAAQRAKMFAAHAASDATGPWRNGAVGYAWLVGTSFGNVPVRVAAGDDPRGFASAINWYPDQGTVIVVLCNSAQARNERDSVARLVRQELFPRPNRGPGNAPPTQTR